MKELQIIPTRTKSSTLQTRQRILRQILFILMFLASSVGGSFTPARAEAGWTAYNDCVYETGQPSANITTINCYNNTTNQTLVNFADGASIPEVTFTVEASGVLLSDQPGANTFDGTDAHNTFNDIASMEGLIRLNDEDDYVTLTFSGLNPEKTYTFATTANRGRNAAGYINRRSRFILQDAEGAINASTSGAAISTTSFEDDTAVFGTGFNTYTGYVARWTNIQPGEDGDFSVSVSIASDSDPIDAYGPAVFMLQEEGNHPPVLSPTGAQSVDEGSELAFSASATDADLPPQTLAFSLVDAPEGASITAEGAFTWTPSEAQGPGDYTFSVKVCDDGDPALCDEEEITASVAEVNSAPVLEAIGDRTVDPLHPLIFTASASDADLPANHLTFSLEGAPEEASIDPETGVFTWTPFEGQGPQDYTFTVKVCDDGDPALCDEEEITVTVNRSNIPPQAVADRYSVEAGRMLVVNAEDGLLANDQDADGDSLVAVLYEGPAQGILVLNEDGSFTYTPAEGFTGEITFTYKVFDGLRYSDFVEATIEVTPAGGTLPKSLFLPLVSWGE